MGEADPESIIDSPAKRTKSSSLSIILFVPTIYCDVVTYCVDIVAAVNTPLTVRFCGKRYPVFEKVVNVRLVAVLADVASEAVTANEAVIGIVLLLPVFNNCDDSLVTVTIQILS